MRYSLVLVVLVLLACSAPQPAPAAPIPTAGPTPNMGGTVQAQVQGTVGALATAIGSEAQAAAERRADVTVQAFINNAAPTIVAQQMATLGAKVPTAATVPPTAASARWNTTQMNISQNNNVKVAFGLIASSHSSAAPKLVAPGDAAKAPWKYFGDIYEFVGTAGLTQDYPPGGSESRALADGQAIGEIVLIDPRETGYTPVDYLMSGDTGAIRVGDTVRVRGYVVGLVDAPNRLGGKTTELVVVGNDLKRTSP